MHHPHRNASPKARRVPSNINPTPNAPPRLLYSRAESAYQLSLSPRAIDYMIAKGTIGIRKIGGRILIPHSELIRVARAGQIEPITPTVKEVSRQEAA